MKSLAAALSLSALLYSCQWSERSVPTQCASDCEQKILQAHSFEMREVPRAFGNHYNVYISGQKAGSVDEQVFHLGDHFDIYAGDRKIGSADEKVLSWGYHTIVFDQSGSKIGELKEQIFKLKPSSQIDIYDANGNLLGHSNEQLFTLTYKARLENAARISIGSTEKELYFDNYTLIADSSIDTRLLLVLCTMEDKISDRAAESSSDDD